MGFQLAEVVPWGRSFDEYVAMFSLTAEDLRAAILGCGDGPASFNAELTRRGGTVTSIDPLYAHSADAIRARIAKIAPVVLGQTRQYADSFVWTHIRSIEHLQEVRLAAMDDFLRDFAAAGSAARYQTGGLPVLPYRDGQFGLALCSHFLFLYSSSLSQQFHVDAIAELCRVAAEARIFPLLELGGAESRHLRPVVGALEARGFSVAISTVPYEFQQGGNRMLVVRSPSPLILHLAAADAWAEAARAGVYEADSLAAEGFIHCSDPDQVVRVANARFRNRRDLMLLQIAVARLEAPLRYENLEGGDERFPHIYGPLPLSAVVRATPFPPDAGGLFEDAQLAAILTGAPAGDA